MTTKRKLGLAVMLATAAMAPALPSIEWRMGSSMAPYYGTEPWQGRGKRKMPKPT